MKGDQKSIQHLNISGQELYINQYFLQRACCRLGA